MSETAEAMLAGLPDRVQWLLADPPAMDKRLIELVAAWPGLTGGRARMADALRLFVITWVRALLGDKLDQMGTGTR